MCLYVTYLNLLLSVFKLDLQSKNIDISPERAIEDLEEMYNVYFSDKKKKIQLIKTVTLRKNQEKILRSVDPKPLREHILI